MEAEGKRMMEMLSDDRKMKSLLNMKELGQNRNRVEVTPKSLRARGNELYLRKDHDALSHQVILRMYSKSVALARAGSEQLAYAYADRSMFLHHVGQNEQSIRDIDRALKIVHTQPLRDKLVDRRSMIARDLLCCTNDKNATVLSAPAEIEEEQQPDGSSQESSGEDDSVLGQITAIFESVDIRYTEQHGRLLVAKRDFAPGQIVFAETIHSMCVNPERFYSHCSNCLKFSWATIPCHDCDWSMFCSEKCRTEAVQKYHDIECPVISAIKHSHEHFIQNYQVPIRTLITAVKKAGSIGKLRDSMELIDQSTDVCWRGFKSEQVFIQDGFVHLCSLSGEQSTSCTLSQDNFDAISLLILVTLAEKSNIFGRKFPPSKNTELINNPDVIFIGALIKKLVRIHANHTYTMQNHVKECEFSGDADVCQAANCCARGKCLAPVSALINHSCYPNVSRCFTDDGQLIIYAIHPIKQNTEILGCYYSSFCVRSKNARQEFLDSYGFTCDCPACKHDWPPLLALCGESEDDIGKKSNPLELEIYREVKKIIVTGEKRPEVDEEDAIEKLSTRIIEASKIVRPPSVLLCYLTKSLEYYFTSKYNYKDEDMGPCVAFKHMWNWHEK